MLFNLILQCLTIVFLLNGRTLSAPLEIPDMNDELGTTIPIEAEETTTTTTTTTTSTTSTTTTTTTTTTLAPEVDREWEDLVLAGPTVVNYLGLFVVLTSRKDTALTVPAEYTVKYVSNVASLRAVLNQVSSAMQGAFQSAIEDLIRTRTSMDQIPDHIKAGLLLIKTAPIDLLKKLLPYTIRNIDRAAKEAASVTKPTLNRFVSVNNLVEEVALLVNAILETPENAEFLVEAKAHSTNIKTQWDLLVKLFRKFSFRADLTQAGINAEFIEPLEQAQNGNGLNGDSARATQLDRLIPAMIHIDQSSHLLDMMARTYSEISDEHMANQLITNRAFVSLASETARLNTLRQLWQNTIEQSVKVARLAQERQNQFAATSPDRKEEYDTYLQEITSH